MQNLAQLQREKEEGRIVIYRSYVVRVFPGKSVCVVAGNQGGESIFVRRRRQVKRDQCWIIAQVLLYGFFFLGGERTLLRQNHNGDAIFVEVPL